jgi:hypothetical protein
LFNNKAESREALRGETKEQKMRSDGKRQGDTGKLKFAFVAILAVLGLEQKAFSQAFDLRLGTGNDQPAVFDFDGGHHACVYGYYGPPVPPFSDSSAPLLPEGGQDVSSRSGFRDFLALQFSPVIGTCQRSEADPEHFTGASGAGRQPRSNRRN